MAKEIRLTRRINTTPDEVFLALTNPLTIELWTDMPANVELKPGGDFNMLDGGINGKIVDFEENKKIIQMWSFGEEYEPSHVTIHLDRENNNTIMTVIQENIPDDAYEDMLEGWKKVIFKGLTDFF